MHSGQPHDAIYKQCQGLRTHAGHHYFKDVPAADVKIPVGRDASEKALKVTTESSREDADRQAIERGEDDGVIVHKSATSSAHNSRDLNAITER